MPEAETTPAAAEAVPAAVATDTPAATAPATPAPETKAPVESLLPDSTAVTAEVEPPAAPATPAPAVNQDESEWFLSDGVKGTGPAPAWYKADKYKTVDEQAKAYGELEKRFGAFTGAPKDGKYDVKLPEGLDGALDMEHPLLKSFSTWAADKQMSPAAFNEVVAMLATYEAELAPDVTTIKASLGENADNRIAAVASWGKANLTADKYEKLREATSGPNAAAVFETMEALIAKTRQPKLPGAGSDVPAGQLTGEAEINAMQAKIGSDGKRLYETDANYRALVEAKRVAFYQSREKAA